MKTLSDGLVEMGIECPEEKLKLIKMYISEIELWNPRYGLVNAGGDDLVVRHILDSLSGLETLRAMGISSMADVGSGAGLPGIPLAIMMPDVSVTLIERSGKRVRFLRNAVAVLNLNNVTVKESDLKDVRDRYDLVTFRAFKPVEPGIVALLMNILKENGLLAAYKGRIDNIRTEIELVRNVALAEDVIPLRVPGLDEERHLVLYRKL